MTWWTALTAFLLFASLSSALLQRDATRSLRNGGSVGEGMRRHANSVVEGDLERRQSSSPTNNTQWDTQTTAACMSALMNLNGMASNPAGMSVCYNLPFLNNSTGVFQADLRLYMISPPTGDFAGIPPQNVQVSLQYFGASVTPISPSQLIGRSIQSEPSQNIEPERRKRAPATPTLVQQYMFVGQINKDLMTQSMNVTTLQGLLIPDVTLNAVSSSGANVSSTLSSDEATFVNGVFSDQANATELAAQAASASAAAASVAAAAPFVLPGTRVLIFPIGAIITGIWAILGVGAVAYGTFGRMQFRDQYRRRVVRVEKGVQARI